MLNSERRGKYIYSQAILVGTLTIYWFTESGNIKNEYVWVWVGTLTMDPRLRTDTKHFL